MRRKPLLHYPIKDLLRVFPFFNKRSSIRVDYNCESRLLAGYQIHEEAKNWSSYISKNLKLKYFNNALDLIIWSL